MTSSRRLDGPRVEVAKDKSAPVSGEKQKRAIQASVYRISEAAYQARSLDDFYRAIHEIITDLMPAKNNFYIALYDKTSDMLSFPYFVDEFEAPPLPEKASRGLTEYVLRSGRALLAPPGVFSDLERRGEVVSVGPASIDWLGVPLKNEEETFGALVVQSYTEGFRFSEEEKEILTFISEQVAMAITRRHAEDALRQSEEMFRSVVENSHNGIVILDDDFRIQYVNDQLVRIFNLSHDESVGADLRSLLDESSLPSVEDRYRRRRAGEKLPSRYEHSVVLKNGTSRNVEVSSSVITDSRNRSQIVVQIRDITDDKRLEKELKGSEERYKHLVENADIAILIDDREGRITYFNETFTKMFGFTQEDREDLTITSIVHPDDTGRVRRNHQGRMQGRRVRRHYEFRGVRKDGSHIQCEVDAIPLKEDGRVVGSRSYVRDISVRKANEERINAQLQEKEVLLREIHHRVKNNLQVISSLLNLQSFYIQDPLALSMFEDSRRRVRSMAMVHEKLYRSENLSQVDFGEYIQSLTRHLFLMYGADPAAVSLDIEAPDLLLDINTAIPCGLLVSELASNALKHAFPDGRKGTIAIRMQRKGEGLIELEFSDDGVGLKDTVNLADSQSFGLQLVDMLTEQLKGRVEIKRDHGTTFVILFKELRFSNRN